MAINTFSNMNTIIVDIISTCCVSVSNNLYFTLVINSLNLHFACGNTCSFTDNSGLCGIPGLPTCGPHLSAGAKVGVGFGVSFACLLLLTCLMCWWKRRQNVLRAQQIASKDVYHFWVILSSHYIPGYLFHHVVQFFFTILGLHRYYCILHLNW